MKSSKVIYTQEKGKISVLQLMFLNITQVLSTADVFLPAFVAKEAQQDSWLSVIIAAAAAIILLNITHFLGAKYPDKTFIQYTVDILGKPIGIAIALLYIYYFIFYAAAITKELEELFVISFNPQSPLIIYGITVVLVVAYAVSKGIEPIARVNEIMLPIGMFVLFFITIINIPNIDLKYFRPTLYNGIYPPLKGAFQALTWFLKTFVLLQFLPFVKNKERNKLRKSLTLSLLILCISLETGVLTIAVFGPITENLLFPALQYVRLASLGTYIENLEISIMLVWVGGIFVNIAIYYYAAVLGLAQLFNFESYKPLIIPIGILIIVLSITGSDTLLTFVLFLQYTLPFYTLVMGFLIPLLLLIISLFKDWHKKRSSLKNNRAGCAE